MDILLDPLVRGLLVTLVFLAIFIEIKTAGVGVAAVIGLLAAILLLGGQWLADSSSWLPAALFFGGAALAAVELFAPGTAVFAVTGTLVMFGGLFLALGGDSTALQYLAGGLITAIVLFALLVKKLPKNKLWAKLVLTHREQNQQGYAALADYTALVGQTGQTLTMLRPAGTALIGARKVDVVTEGEFLPSNTQVIVIGAVGRRIIVAERKEAN